MLTSFRFLALVFFAIALSVPARAQDAAEIMLRLDRLEAQNRSLTGQLEQAQNQVRRLEDQLKRFQADVDFRFQDAQGNKGAVRPAPTPGGASPPPAKRSDAFDPAAQPAAPGAPQQLGSATTGTVRPLPNGPRAPAGDIMSEDRPPGGSPLATGEPLGLGTVGSRPPGGPAPTVAAIPNASAQDDLTLAKSFLQRGDYELAEGQFREFMRSYPKDRLAPEAMYGLAETYFLRQRYQEAAEQYLNLSTQYSQSSRAPEGLLKLAMSLRAIGERDQACGTLGEIGRKYPRAAASVKQAVEREQKRSRC